MATTNGTRAIVAAREAPLLLAAALVNARATAQALALAGNDVMLLCAGTNGEVAPEDLLGAGAVLSELQALAPASPGGPAAMDALELFTSARQDLPRALANTQGGRNVIDAGLQDDIVFAARLNSIPVVAAILSNPLRVANVPPQAR